MALVKVIWKPDRRQLQLFGGVACLVFAALGGVALIFDRLVWHPLSPETASILGWCFWGFSTVCLLLCAVAPRGLLPVYWFLTVVTIPVGFVVSHVVMAVVYYGVITPIGFFLHLSGRNPLARHLDPQASSYWVRRERVRDKKGYFRQF